MPRAKKERKETAPTRFSTRSTRGSIKPDPEPSPSPSPSPPRESVKPEPSPSPPPEVEDKYPDDVARVFNLLDLDKTGMITLDNLKSISKELNVEIPDEELHEMIAEADTDGDSQINKQEFYNIMKKSNLY